MKHRTWTTGRRIFGRLSDLIIRSGAGHKWEGDEAKRRNRLMGFTVGGAASWLGSAATAINAWQVTVREMRHWGWLNGAMAGRN